MKVYEVTKINSLKMETRVAAFSSKAKVCGFFHGIILQSNRVAVKTTEGEFLYGEKARITAKNVVNRMVIDADDAFSPCYKVREIEVL